MAETRYYPEDHPTRKRCEIVACEADQKFLDELYRYPSDHAFSIRYGGNLYVRGGERIDPDDPDAVRPRRPRLSRQAAKKFISGSGEDILNEGQRQNNSTAEEAKQNYEWKNVGAIVLSAYNHSVLEVNKNKSSRGNYNGIDVRLSRKHYLTINPIYSLIKSKLCDEIYMYFYELGHGKVGLRCERTYVQIKERTMAGVTINRCKMKPTYLNFDSNNLMNAKYYIQCRINKLQKLVNYKILTCTLILKEKAKHRKYDRCYTISAKRESRWGLQTSGGISKMIMCKHKYVVPETNMKSRRSLNITDGVGKIILCKQVMCKHRYVTPVTAMRSRRSLNIIDGAVKKLLFKQVKHKESCKGGKKIILNEKMQLPKLIKLQG